MNQLEVIRKENERLLAVEYCFKEWIEKTSWVQKTAQPHELGMHRADVLKNRIEALRKENEKLNALLLATNNDLMNALYDIERLKEEKKSLQNQVNEFEMKLAKERAK